MLIRSLEMKISIETVLAWKLFFDKNYKLYVYIYISVLRNA